jgi:hypothetical protein
MTPAAIFGTVLGLVAGVGFIHLNQSILRWRKGERK